MKSNSVSVGMDDYQAQDDMRTLTRAEEIKADAKRHEKALSHGKQQMAALQNVVKPDADADDKLPKRGQRTATHAKTKAMAPTKRAAKVNRSNVI